jgi:hypothetical protein
MRRAPTQNQATRTLEDLLDRSPQATGSAQDVWQAHFSPAAFLLIQNNFPCSTAASACRTQKRR